MSSATSTPQAAYRKVQLKTEYALERIQAELDFAQMLCERRPKEARKWRDLISKATEIASKAAESGSEREVVEAVGKAEAILSPLAKAAKEYTVYCVGHGHIDMNWMWSWQETVAVTNDTFTTVLRLMEEFPEFHYSQSQACVYQIMEKHNPELLAKITRRVKEGRWEVTASHWVEGDKNLAGGEALCRHLLYTRQYMLELFGLSPEEVPIDWSPDTFGHAATMPTYLVRGGVQYLYLHRPGVHGPKRPPAFRWQAPDGSTVLVHNDMLAGYNGTIKPGMVEHLGRMTRETGLTFGLWVYGVGDHGGGPTRRDIVRGLDMNTWPVYPNIEFSTARKYFDRLDREGRQLPVLDYELNTEFTGCYTTQTLIKKDNRYGENRLTDAETAATLAWAGLGKEYPAANLREGWRDTLFSHFHDILPGSGVRDTRHYTHGLYQKTIATTSQVEIQAWRSLAAQIDTSAARTEAESVPPSQEPSTVGAGAGWDATAMPISRADESGGFGPRPYVIFNPTAWDRQEVIEALVWEGAPDLSQQELSKIPFSVTDSQGRTYEAQVLNVYDGWGHKNVQLAFPVKVPAMGYGRYIVREEKAEPLGAACGQIGHTNQCSYAPVECGPEGLENEFLRLELNVTNGGILRLLDKRSQTALIDPAQAAPALEYAVERPHGMTAWSMGPTGPVEQPRVLAIERKQKGPYVSSIEVTLKIHESQFTLTYELRAGDPRLYLHLKGTWFERGSRETGVPLLRMSFPFALQDTQARYEIPFGAIDREYRDGEEVPGLQWAQVTGKIGKNQAGCLLLNDSKYGHSLQDNALRLTLIRSSYDPDPLPEIGSHEVHVALCPFAGEMPVAQAIRAGWNFNHDLRVVSTDAHEGPLAPEAGLIRVKPDSIVLSAIKKAEGNEGAVLLRFFDPTGKGTQAQATLDSKFWGTITEAVEVDLLERPVKKSTAQAKNGTISVTVPARGIASVRVKVKRR